MLPAAIRVSGIKTMAKLQLVTLLTDFGMSDPYVAATKGAILRSCPYARIVDICHNVPPHDIVAGAFVLAQAAPEFPPGTLHVVVVDPGVGTQRRILVGKFDDQFFLFPDNGVITLIAQMLPMQGIYSVRNTQYLPVEDVSATFHGRDLFAPIAGHILNGLNIEKLGPPPETYKLLELPVVGENENELTGEVIYVDQFGNLISNISEEMVSKRWDNLTSLQLSCDGKEVGQFQGTYGFAEKNQPLALFNSMGLVEIAVNCGSAAEYFKAGVGARVVLSERPMER